MTELQQSRMLPTLCMKSGIHIYYKYPEKKGKTKEVTKRVRFQL